MLTFEKSISIARPPQEVFDYFADPANRSEWTSSAVSSEWTTEPPHGVGSRQRGVDKFLGRRIQSEAEITAWDPPNMHSGKVTKPFSGEFTARFTEQEGGTELTMSIQAEVGGLFRIAEGLVSKQLERAMDADLNALKLILESQ